MLDIRTALKEDLGCSTAELVYGTTVRIPREFFSQSSADVIADPASYAVQLKASMQKLQAVPAQQQDRKTYIDTTLSSCTHVFVRHDSV